ncbi:hypothetical protein [Streptomyces sp. NPDC051162]|uniref:hypothetical protein n=1 Tax=Streptomyces sp. NPDC051162 TaxID=3154747 RepID=UPI003413D396
MNDCWHRPKIAARSWDSELHLLSDDDPLGGMRPLLDADDAILGYEPEGFSDRCWILHALHEGTDRVRWNDVLARSGRGLDQWTGNLSFLVFEGKISPPAFEVPLLGEPDRDSLTRLVEILARHSLGGMDTDCYWGQAAIEDLGSPTVARRGRLREAVELYDACQDPTSGVSTQFPAQWWPEDRSWYVLTNWDLNATEVFGSEELIAAVLADRRLEAVRHPSIGEVGDEAVGWDGRVT